MLLERKYEPEKTFPWYKKINPIWWLQNDADGWFPDHYLPEESWIKRAVLYFLRNPFHNFTFFIIGFRDKPSVSYAKNPNTTHIDGEFNYGYTKVYGWLPVPFISFRKWGAEGYVGWRVPGAAFGLKLRKYSG